MIGKCRKIGAWVENNGFKQRLPLHPEESNKIYEILSFMVKGTTTYAVLNDIETGLLSEEPISILEIIRS